MKSRHLTKSEILKHLEAYHKCGLNKIDYCRQSRLNYTTFHTWLRKFDFGKPQFTEIKIPPIIPTSSDQIIMKISSNLELLFPSTTTAMYLAQVLSEYNRLNVNQC